MHHEATVNRIETPSYLILPSSKISTTHLSKHAVVYVRQSSTRQVRENIESTQLQYALVERAKAYGWSASQVVTIDDDLGISGQSLEGRHGFQRLLAEISLGHVGIVFGLEMSRLARNCKDWHHLLELCGVFGSLLGDADGIYNPRDHNDRLLLGLKGTMSEAELHILRGRLNAGIRNKAMRGEYFCNVPVGYVRTREGVTLDPDEQVRTVVKMIFDKFEELGSVNAVLQYCHHESVEIGIRDYNGPTLNPIQIRPVNRSLLVNMIHNPIYAGAYVFGRKKADPCKRIPGKPQSGRKRVEPEEWKVFIPDKLPAYITRDQWEKNRKKLKENSTRFHSGPSRGASILAGRVVCGKCGAHMFVHYGHKGVPNFTCCQKRMSYGGDICQSFTASYLEQLIEQLVLKALEPASIEISLKAVEQVETERARLEKHHSQSVQRATYDSTLARRRFEEVDPSNRLVAAELEREWESRLQLQRKSEEMLNRFRSETPVRLSSVQRTAIETMSKDFPSLWESSLTTMIDRQNITRALIEKIEVEVVNDSERLAITVHWSGGFASHHESRRRVQVFDQLEYSQGLASRIQQLYDEGYPLLEIANVLNREGFKPTRGKQFTQTSMGALCRMLRSRGMIKLSPSLKPNFWRASKLAEELGIAKPTLTTWRYKGWVQYRKIGTRWLYWVDEAEMARLRKVLGQPRDGSVKMPTELITPISKMPAIAD